MSKKRKALLRTKYENQDGRCIWCGKKMVLELDRHIGDETTPLLATREHLIPRNRGGKNWPENIVAACLKCNNERGGRLTAPCVHKNALVCLLPRDHLLRVAAIYRRLGKTYQARQVSLDVKLVDE